MTSASERALLFGSIVLLPFENYASIGGYSILYFAFAAVLVYALVARQRELLAVLFEPTFCAAYVLLITCLVVETLHWNSSYAELGRIAQMVIAALAVAALCRDRAAAQVVVVAMLVVGLALSAVIMTTAYDRLAQASADTFTEASQVRAEAFSGFVLADNVNRVSFLAAVGSALSLLFALDSRDPARAALGYAGAMVCALGALLPMSRGGATMLIALAAFVALVSGAGAKRIALSVGAVALVTIALAPAAIFSRYSLATEQNVPIDARAKIYSAAITYFPSYWPFGLGEGNFNGWWGRQSVFWNGFRVIGPHNCFIEMVMMWGAPGLAAFVSLLWLAYRSLALRPRLDAVDAGRWVIGLSLLCWMLFVGEFYHKEFAVGLGLAAASRRWLA